MKKVLTTVAVFFALALTACGTPSTTSESKGEESQPSQTSSAHTHKWGDWTRVKEPTCTEKGQEKRTCDCGQEQTRDVAAKGHTWVEDATKAVAATCATPGKKVSKCSVCNETKEEDIPTLEHKWVATNATPREETGFATLNQFKCDYGDHYALRFSASDFDEAATLAACGLEAKDTTVYPELNSSGSHSGSIRLRLAENKGGTEALGTHVIYKIKLNAAVENASLEFEIDPKSGYDVPVFDYVSNDDQQGYRKINGELKLTEKRYGLRVNGTEIDLGADKYGDVNGGSKLWFDWNVKLNLVAGENTIDVYCLGGYRAYIYNFQLTNLPVGA